MTFSTEFNPMYNIDKDYQTNAPTYYDYMAEIKDTVTNLFEDVTTAVDTELTKTIQSKGTLIEITKQEISPKRTNYVIEVKQDPNKEGRLNSTDGLISVNRVGDTTNLTVATDDILDKLSVLANEGVTIEKTGKTKISIGVDFNTVQRKLIAGDNISISALGEISATRDANVASKEAKITTLLDGTRAGGVFQNLPSEGYVFEDVRINEIKTEGTYYISASTSPTGGGAWLIVRSAKNWGACVQFLIREYGAGVYWRTGTPSKRASGDGKVDGYWTEWNTVEVFDPISGSKRGLSKLTQENVNKSLGHSDKGLISPDGSKEYHFYRYSNNTIKQQRFLFRNYKKDDKFQSFAIKPRSRTMYKFSEQENIGGVMRNRVQIYDWQQGRRIREFYTKGSLGHANDATFRGDDIWVANSAAGVYKFIPERLTDDDSIEYYRCPFIPTNKVGNAYRRVSGITNDEDNADILYVMTNDETDGKIASSDRVIIWKWNTKDNTYTKMYDAPRTRWFVQGLEYFKGKFYVAYSKENETTNHVGIEIDVINKTTQLVEETFVMSGLFEPEGLHLLDACTMDKHGTITEWDAYLAVGIAEPTAEQAFTSIGLEPATSGIAHYGDNW